jgi:TetR/AcrR family transcriptional regulator, cholesterol catabolism regulator
MTGPPAELATGAREAIFAAATRLFGERGYTGTTIRDIATTVGILPGSLYAHIASKEALLLEIIESGVDRFNGAADDVTTAGLEPVEALREAVRRHVAIVADNPERTLIVFHQWRFLSPENRTRMLAKRAYYQEFFMRTVRAGMEAGVLDATLDARITVLGILGALNWTPEWLSPTGPATPAQVADRIADSLLRGALAR